MKLFEWLPESEENCRGRRDGHYLWMNCHHLHLGKVDVMLGGMVFMTLHPFRVLRRLCIKRWSSAEWELSLWLIHFYFNPYVPYVPDDDDLYANDN